MKITITGAGGLVGSHLAKDLAGEHQTSALTHRDLDITDRAAVRQLFLRERPDLIINCAVLGVDECEINPARAHAVNCAGPHVLAEVASEIDADFLHFSTNYVFDGAERGRAPYTVEDEPRPINVYGETKLAGERAARAAAPRSFVIRTSWVYGAGKDSFLGTAHRHLLAGKQVRAISDVWANTTFVGDLVARTKEIIARRRYDTYHVVNEGVCSYHEFALEAARLVGGGEAERLIEAVSEDAARRTARRPRYTPMRCLVSERLGLAPMREWRAALADYVSQKAR